MSRALKTRLWINAAALLLLLVLFGGDVVDALRARSAPVAALLLPPNLGFAIAALVVGFATAGVSAWGWWRGREDDFRGYRLLPIAVSVLVFLDLFVLNEDRPPYHSHEVVAAALSHLEQRAIYLGEAGRVVSSRAPLEPILAELGAPPYLHHGARIPAWTLVVRSGCTGPLLEADGLAAGTLVYCVAQDETRAWLTAVGLPWNERFGAPQVVTSPKGVLLGVVEPAPPPAPAHGLEALPPLRPSPAAPAPPGG